VRSVKTVRSETGEMSQGVVEERERKHQRTARVTAALLSLGNSLSWAVAVLDMEFWLKGRSPVACPPPFP
jgi:hypothetical protein